MRKTSALSIPTLACGGTSSSATEARAVRAVRAFAGGLRGCTGTRQTTQEYSLRTDLTLDITERQAAVHVADGKPFRHWQFAEVLGRRRTRRGLGMKTCGALLPPWAEAGRHKKTDAEGRRDSCHENSRSW